MIKYNDEKQLGEKSVYFDYISTSGSITNRSQDRNLEAGDAAELRESVKKECTQRLAKDLL